MLENPPCISLRGSYNFLKPKVMENYQEMGNFQKEYIPCTPGVTTWKRTLGLAPISPRDKPETGKFILSIQINESQTCANYAYKQNKLTFASFAHLLYLSERVLCDSFNNKGYRE